MNLESPTDNAFVFVVCGAAAYIAQLNYSLRALRRASRSRILVVTDLGRNEQRIDWDDVIEFATPRDLNDHQASIYLKTSLHKVLPGGLRYCYLDTDIVALRPEVDEIFLHKSGPVTFAADHIKLSEFSPYALHCGCLERHRSDLIELELMLIDVAARSSRRARSRAPELRARVEQVTSRIERILARIPFRHAGPDPRKEAPERERWRLDNKNVETRERQARWSRDPVRDRWYSPEGHEVHTVCCNHLVERIRQKFGIPVRDSKWQHWNGGVFLFDSLANEFLDAWHRRTMAIFTDPEWRTRDQGTLAATAWEFGLQDSAVLGKEFNLIVDYFQKGRIGIAADGSKVSNDNFATSTTTYLIHVLNHFGDKTWDVWDWVDRQVQNHEAVGRNGSGSDPHGLEIQGQTSSKAS